MQVGPGTKIDALLAEYPFLADTLAAHAPRLARLKNPFARKTFGRIATLATAARMAATDLDGLLTAVAASIGEHTGQQVELSGAPAPDDTDPLAELREIIRELHAGGDQADLTRRFASLARRVSATEIAELEQQLVAEGMPEEEIKRLCDVHAAIFRQSLAKPEGPELVPGHPVRTMRAENAALRGTVASLRGALASLETEADADATRQPLARGLEALSQVELHYLRKEYGWFPVLEQYGVEAPPKVMWSVHDDIRAQLKGARERLEAADLRGLAAELPVLLQAVEDMFLKEEDILFPLCLDLFSEEDWARVQRGEREFGYIVEPEPGFAPAEARGAEVQGRTARVEFPTGALSEEQLRLILQRLPFDLTFVDEDDTVRFYSEGDRIFPRSPGVIGRKVQNCHPPKSVHMVERILAAFRDGSKDVAEFWLELKGRFVHIRYFVVRDGEGRYRGTLEVVQDITSLRKLEGQRTLLDW